MWPIDKWGDPLPQAMLDKCLAADSVLLGAVGGPKWEGLPGPQRPEKGLLRLRAGMGLYSNLRPAKLWPQLADASPLKPSIVEKGIDFMVVRELISGIYFGEHKTVEQNGEQVATDVMLYAEHEIERIGRIAFETARKRRHKVTCVDQGQRAGHQPPVARRDAPAAAGVSGRGIHRDVRGQRRHAGGKGSQPV